MVCIQCRLPDLQHIEGAKCQPVSAYGPRAFCALSAGCPGLQHIEVAKCQLVSIEGLRTWCALSAGGPVWQHIEGLEGRAAGPG
jgi:hypothetical protein